MRFKLLFCIAILSVASPRLSHAEYNYSEIEWKQLQTENFVIHYYDDVEWTARKVAQAAEKAYPIVTTIYDHKPSSKTNIVVRDDRDISNGFAVFQLNWMTIWATPSTLRLRARRNWIENVVTHEFAHIVSLQKSSGAGFWIDGLRIGGVKNRTSNNNVDMGATVFLPSNPYIRWWAEGVAQLDTEIAGLDQFDPNREMFLRACTLENQLLSFAQMRNITTRESLGGEAVYNQGYAFLRWLREKYGKDSHANLASEADQIWKPDFDMHFPSVFSKTAEELHEEWVLDLQKQFADQVRSMVPHKTQGNPIRYIQSDRLQKLNRDDERIADGILNANPEFSPDGHWYSQINGSKLILIYRDEPFTVPQAQEENDESAIPPLELSVDANFYTWGPDSKEIILSKRRSNIFGGYPYFDLYKISLEDFSNARKTLFESGSLPLEKGKRKRALKAYSKSLSSARFHEKRLTHNQRATHPAWSPNGNLVVFSKNHDGHRNLLSMRPDGSEIQSLFEIGGDAEVTETRFAPSGRFLVFTLFHHGQSDIWLLPLDSRTPRPLTFDSADDRDPWITKDESTLYFSSDRSGIFQIYRLPIQEGLKSDPLPVTAVETGAFMPYVSPSEDEMLYIQFHCSGFKPYSSRLPTDLPSPPKQRTSEVSQERVKSMLTPEPAPLPTLSGEKRWFSGFRPPRFFPSLIIENQQFKAGLAVQVSDFLEKHSLTGLALFGLDQDYQIEYVNRSFYPTIFGRYTAFIRNNPRIFFSDGDANNDDPETLIRDSIEFIDAGLSQSLRTYDFLPGTHEFTLQYSRRSVDRRLGIPIFANGNLETQFRVLTNDGLRFGWLWESVPTQMRSDQDINPQNQHSLEASYRLVHTHLFSADTSIPAPNKNYFYHEGMLSIDQYIGMPFVSSWWKEHTFWWKLRGGWKSRDVNVNDQFFLGARVNYRAFGEISSTTNFYGYEDFSISGETLLLASLGYTLPLIRRADKKLGPLYFDSLFLSIFGETGNAWDYGELENFNQNPTRDPSLQDGTILLTDVGLQLKSKMYLFHDANPWHSTVTVAHGFQDSAKYGFRDGDLPVRIYVGIGTNF